MVVALVMWVDAYLIYFGLDFNCIYLFAFEYMGKKIIHPLQLLNIAHHRWHHKPFGRAFWILCLDVHTTSAVLWASATNFHVVFFFCICKIWGHRKLLLKAKAHNRLVLTCWEEAGTSAPVLGFILLCWEVWEKSPKGLIKETYLQEQRRRQTACTHIITQRWQSAGRHRSADHVCRPPCPFNWINTARGWKRCTEKAPQQMVE